MSIPSVISVVPLAGDLIAVQGGLVPIAWTTDVPVTEGEFSLWFVSPSNGWYGPYLVAEDGSASYAANAPAGFPVGGGYHLFVYWRPEGGSWTVYGTDSAHPVDILPAPAVTAVDPGSGPAGTLVVISGSNFRESMSTVYFGGVSVGPRYSVVDPTQVVARVPAGAGTAAIYVEDGGVVSAAGPELHLRPGAGSTRRRRRECAHGGLSDPQHGRWQRRRRHRDHHRQRLHDHAGRPLRGE